MIEMLGVLAIIGVLSAGGIMGYSAAMESYKVNKTVEDISNSIAQAQNLFIGNSGIQYKNPPALKNLGLIPENYKVIPCPNNAKYPEKIGESICVESPLGPAHFPFEYDTQHRYGFVWRFNMWAIFFNLPESACIKLFSAMDWTKLGHIHTELNAVAITGKVTPEEAKDLCKLESDTSRIILVFKGKKG